MPTNYFGLGIDGERYARARPQVHASAIAAFRVCSGIQTPVGRALDVGCGTGQSTVALASIAESIVGIDPSPEMLSHAAPHPKVQYAEGAAENLPFPDGDFDLIAAGLAFHWFDANAFLAESRRVLRSPGWLAIYTTGFTGEMIEEPAFAGWFRGEFLSRYPTPSRSPVAVTRSLAEANGLTLIGEQSFTDDVEMTVQRFVDYELSTTNIIAAAGRSDDSYQGASDWMHASLEPFFRERQRGTFRFVGKVWSLRKQAA